ncbi:Protein of unknown function [Gryllus bimaculatus]|nr:Protein of unknown function [Gryllus bimaculatus]
MGKVTSPPAWRRHCAAAATAPYGVRRGVGAGRGPCESSDTSATPDRRWRPCCPQRRCLCWHC